MRRVPATDFAFMLYCFEAGRWLVARLLPHGDDLVESCKVGILRQRGAFSAWCGVDWSLEGRLNRCFGLEGVLAGSDLASESPSLAAHGAVSLCFGIVEVSRWLFRPLKAYAERFTELGETSEECPLVSLSSTVLARRIVATVWRMRRRKAVACAQILSIGSIFSLPV